MCNPAVAVAFTGASGAYSAYSQYQTGLGQEAYYNYLADKGVQQNQITARIRDQNIEAVKEGALSTTGSISRKAASDTQSLQRRVKQVQGAQDATLAANGVGGSVTAEDIARDTLSKSELDQMAIRYNADSAITATNNEAKQREFAIGQDADFKIWDTTNQANEARFAAKSAKNAGILNAGSTLLGTAGSVAGNWYNLKNPSFGRAR